MMALTRKLELELSAAQADLRNADAELAWLTERVAEMRTWRDTVQEEARALANALTAARARAERPMPDVTMHLVDQAA